MLGSSFNWNFISTAPGSTAPRTTSNYGGLSNCAVGLVREIPPSFHLLANYMCKEGCGVQYGTNPSTIFFTNLQFNFAVAVTTGEGYPDV